jgi:hypothetical protein
VGFDVEHLGFEGRLLADLECEQIGRALLEALGFGVLDLLREIHVAARLPDLLVRGDDGAVAVAHVGGDTVAGEFSIGAVFVTSAVPANAEAAASVSVSGRMGSAWVVLVSLVFRGRTNLPGQCYEQMASK